MTRTKGQFSFILRNGCFIWGVTAFIFFMFLRMTYNYELYSRGEMEIVCKDVRISICAGLTYGLGMAAFIWRRNESEYLTALSSTEYETKS